MSYEPNKLSRKDSELSSMPPTLRGAPTKKSMMSSKVSNAHAETLAAYSDAPPVPKQVQNWKIYLTAIGLGMGAAAYGYDTGFFGGTIALPVFRDTFGITTMSQADKDSTSANLVSLFQGGSFFGAALQLPFTNRFGRWWSIVFSNVVFIASAFMQIFANGSLGLMMGGRFLGGLAIGISSLVIPVMLSEIAPPSIRGRLVGFYDIFIQVGTLFGFWANYIIIRVQPYGSFQWMFPTAVQVFPAAILAVSMFFTPESPKFLMEKGKYDEAARVLSRLRTLPIEHEYVQYELRLTREAVEAENLIKGDDTEWQLLGQLFRNPGHRYRVFLGMMLILFKTFSGVQAVNYYSPRIFEDLGFQGASNSLFATGLYGSVKAICTVIFGLFLVDRIGRRLPLIVGAIVGSFCLFYLGSFLSIRGPKPAGEGLTSGDISAIFFIFLYAAWYNFGYNSVPLTLISEIFTQRYRTMSMTICLMWQWLCTFSIVRIMPIALTSLGPRTYFIFACTFLSAAPFVYFLIPETKGLPLEAMDQLFGGVQRSDVEKALMTESGVKGTSSHLENIDDATAVPGLAHTPTLTHIKE